MIDSGSTWTSSVQLHRRLIYCRPCVRLASPSPLSTSSEVLSDLDFTDANSRCQRLQIHFELGHVAILRPQVTSDGYTHDWEVYVRPSEGATNVDALHFIDRVEFHLHETYDRRTVVLNEAPFHVVESGYGGFLLPVDIYLRTPCEPKRLRFLYDLQLDSSCSVACVRYEKLVFWNPVEPLRSALRRSAAVSYVSRWRSNLPPSASLLTSPSSAAGVSASYSSGYCSNCSTELHDSKATPLRLLDLQRRHRTCRSSDVIKMTSLNTVLAGSSSSSSQPPSVKHELDSTMQEGLPLTKWVDVAPKWGNSSLSSPSGAQDVKPDSGSKSAITFLQSWLRQVPSSNVDQSTVQRTPMSAGTVAGSSKRRKGRPRKYVAAAGDRTLTGDALLVDTTCDSGLGRFAVVPRELPLPSPPRPTVERPPPTVPQQPVASDPKPPAAKLAKVSRRKDKASAFQRCRRQPVKFIPAATKRSPAKPKAKPRQKSSSLSKPVGGGTSVVAGSEGKRRRGRPRKHPVAVSKPTPAVRDVTPARRPLSDVEGDSSDSDVIVTGYTAPRDVVSGSRVAPTSMDGRKRSGSCTTGCGNSRRTGVDEPRRAENPEVAQPVKRKRGRPRKYPLPIDAVTVTRTAGRTQVDTSHPVTVKDRGSTADRRRVTRAVTAATIQQEWDTSRSATPARTHTPPLYLELSSSDDEVLAVPDFRPDVDRQPNNFRRQNRKRRRSIPSRSLELSFSSIEKDDDVIGRSRDRGACRPAEMTSTPRLKESALRSRWINVEHRAEVTTSATVHRDAEGHPASTRDAADRRQSPVHRRKRQRRRSGGNENDPDWRRYPTKPQARRPSPRGPSIAPDATSPDVLPYDEAELDVLVELQRRLASTGDPHVLRQVVEIIEASGRYHVEDATFDFDLCSLDRGTITKLRRCLRV